MAADDRGLPVNRRRFVQGVGALGLGLVTGCGRLPGQSPPAPPKVPTIGWLTVAGEAADESAPVENLEAFRQGLAALGYVEGQSVILQTRYVQGPAGLGEAAADLVRLPVDVIVTNGTPAARAAQAATSTIPIVFASGGNPVGAGLVASLARPGGNVTGLANLIQELSGKRLEFLPQAVPGLRRVAFLWDALSTTSSSVQEMEAATQALGVRLQVLEIREVADYEAAFAAAGAEQADALMMSSGINSPNSARIISLAARERLPAMYTNGQAVRHGGLMAYGTNRLDLHRRAATYVDKILKGAQPADLPVEQPMRFDLAINLQTAQALGLTIPDRVLLQATEVIQ